MANKNIYVVTGNSIEELEQDLALMKATIKMGATMGCGGSDLQNVELGVDILKNYLNTEDNECQNENVEYDYEAIRQEIFDTWRANETGLFDTMVDILTDYGLTVDEFDKGLRGE